MDDEEMNRMFDEIKQYTDTLHKNMDALLPLITASIDSLIQHQKRDVHKIEKILDTLLDFGQFDVGKEEFYRLNSYYGSFDPDAAIDYHQYYKEMNGEE